VKLQGMRIRPLTPDLWPALADLFADSKTCSQCWCMYWRIGAAYRDRSPNANRSALRKLVKDGPAPGLLALDDDLAIGWCQLTPRDDLPALDRAKRLPRVDDLPVWSLSCFYIRKSHRRQGVSTALLDAAIATAKKAGAPALEAYPLDRDLTSTTTFTGYTTTFTEAGFEVVACEKSSRPVMRLDLGARLRRPRSTR
jgi:GNAT superfamily N-acetyltransferase